MPASAPPTREEVRRLIGSLSADSHCVLALGSESVPGSEPAATGAATVVVKLSPAVDVDAALELLRTVRAWARDGEPAMSSRQEEACHVRRAAS